MSVKAIKQTAIGRVLVIGMGDANAAKMLQDDPLWVLTEDLQLPPAIVLVGWKRPNGDIGIPEIYERASRAKKLPLLVIGVDAEQLQPGVAVNWMANDGFPFPIIDCYVELMRGKNEQEMFQRIRGDIKPDTSLTVQGFPPGEFRPHSDN